MAIASWAVAVIIESNGLTFHASGQQLRNMIKLMLFTAVAVYSVVKRESIESLSNITLGIYGRWNRNYNYSLPRNFHLTCRS